VFPMKGSIGMRLFAVVPALSVLLTAASTYAQAPAAPRTPAPAGQSTPAPRPQAQTPSTAKQPDPPPAAALPPPPAQPAVAFRDGAKSGWVNVQVVASQSQEGKNAAVRIKALQDQHQKTLSDKQKALQAAQAKLESEGALRSESARATLQGDIERQSKELQRLAEDADQDVERMQQQMQQEFLTKLQPALNRVVKERGVDFLFTSEVLVFGAPDLNLTEDVIKAIDSAAKPSAAAPAAPKPPPATPAPPPAK
jgi:outer membrane protein